MSFDVDLTDTPATVPFEIGPDETLLDPDEGQEATATLADPSEGDWEDVEDDDTPATAETNEEPEATSEPAEPENAEESPQEEPVEPENGATSGDEFFEELDLLGRMADAHQKLQVISGTLDLTKEKVKNLRDRYKAAEAEVLEIASEIADLMGDGSRSETTSQGSGPTEESGSADPEPAEAAEPADPDAWRHKSTAELLVGIKGLGKKKLDAISAMAPTVGDLEDIRGNASRANRPFNDLLPDGVGRGAADAIENRLIDHVATFAVADPEPPEASEDPAEPSEANSKPADEPAGDDGAGEKSEAKEANSKPADEPAE